jgi:hypothetical protein
MVLCSVVSTVHIFSVFRPNRLCLQGPGYFVLETQPCCIVVVVVVLQSCCVVFIELTAAFAAIFFHLKLDLFI